MRREAPHHRQHPHSRCSPPTRLPLWRTAPRPPRAPPPTPLPRRLAPPRPPPGLDRRHPPSGARPARRGAPYHRHPHPPPSGSHCSYDSEKQSFRRNRRCRWLQINEGPVLYARVALSQFPRTLRHDLPTRKTPPQDPHFPRRRHETLLSRITEHNPAWWAITGFENLGQEGFPGGTRYGLRQRGRGWTKER